MRYALEERRDADDDRLVFLLPWEDREKYPYAGQPPSIETCSFCGKKWSEVENFTTSDSAAICGDCVSEIHQAMKT
ncbi:MAG: ClpX C4-type zinc finger protein, partial [Candidatus Korobacteraceae bacterium]